MSLIDVLVEREREENERPQNRLRIEFSSWKESNVTPPRVA